jgi:RHS repeat-associated protein
VPAEKTSGKPGEAPPRPPEPRTDIVGPRVNRPDPQVPGLDRAVTAAVDVKKSQPSSGFDANKSREDESKRTPYSTEFANPDGSRTLRIFAGERYVTANGKRVPADTKLEKSGDGRVRPKNAVPLTIAGKGDDPALVSLDLADGAKVEFALDQAAGVAVESDDFKSNGAGQGKARFRGIRPHSDLELTAALWGAKEDLVLHSADAPATWDFTLKLTGGIKAELDPRTGAVQLKKPGGEVKGVVPPGFMTDSDIDPRSGEGNRSNGVKYALSEQNGVTKLRIELDQAWLKDPKRKYPVVVDPSIRDNTDADDTYVMSNATPFSSAWETELKAGTYDGGGHVAASYLHFHDAINSLRNHYILGASLSVLEIYSYCCPAQARPLDVYRVTSPWGTEVDRWPGPSWDGGSLGSANVSYGTNAGWITIGLPAERMTRWVHGTESFHGFRLGASYSDSYGWKRFASAQSPQPNNIPFLDVSYSVEGAGYTLPHGGYTTPVTSIADGTLPVSVTNWGTSTWNSSWVLRQSVYNSAGEDMIAKLGAAGEAAYRQFTVPGNVGPHQSVTIDVKTPKMPPDNYRLVLGMAHSGRADYYPFGDVPRFEGGVGVPNTPPTIKGNRPANNALVDTLRPALWVDYVDPDGWPAAGVRKYWYEMCGGAPGAPVGCVNSGWQNGATWTPPSGPLKWSTAGHWFVKLSDGTTETPKIGPFNLTPVVPQPAIMSKLAGTSEAGDLPGVNPQAGNFGTSAVDVNISVAGPPLVVSRTYNSQDPRTAGAFGTGWTTPLDQRITEDGDGSGNVVATLATGLELRFGRNPDGTFAPPPGVNLTLVRSASEWTLRDAKGTRRTFDLGGRLLKITDASGNTQSVVYQGTSTEINKIKDDVSGRQLHLTWSGGHVVSVSTDAPDATTPASTWNYTYDGGKLTRVCSPLSAESCTGYEYTQSAHYRAAVTDDNPTAYWTLGEATGTTATNLVARSAGEFDASYQNVNLAAAGAITGSTDLSAGLDAARNSVVLAPNDLLGKDMSFAMELWFKADPGRSGLLIGEQNAAFGASPSTYTPFLYVATGGKLRGNVWTTPSGGAQMVSSGRVDDGAWHHVVLSTAVDTHTLFLDGQQIGQVTGLIDHQGTTTMTVGNGYAHSWPEAAAGYFPFTGSIDEVAIYRHPLSATQVADHARLRTSTERLNKIIEPGLFTATSLTYDGQGGRVTGLTDRNGANWTLGGSVAGDKVRTVKLSSSVRADVTYTYDTMNGNRLTERKDQYGSTTWEYNEAGFVSVTTDPTGWGTYTDTDARGNVVLSINRSSGWSYRQYKYFHNPADPLDPRNDTLLWQSNGYGWGHEDAFKTHYSVDAAGRVVQVTYPKPSGAVTNPVETFRYATGAEPSVDGGTTPAGKLLTHTGQRGETTSYYYWKSGDLGSVVDPAEMRHEHAYDALGRMKIRHASKKVNGAWTDIGTTSYTYNALSLPVTITAPPVANTLTGVTHQAVTTNTYDRSGRRAQVSISDATGGDATRTTKYGYDAAGRLTSTTAPDNTVTKQEWDSAGDRVKTIDAGNRVLEHVFDDRHLLTETVAVGQGVDPLDSASTRLVVESRAYDPVGRLATLVDAQGREREYAYHGNGPLYHEQVIERDAAGNVTNDDNVKMYEYDGAGNLVSHWDNFREQLYAYDDAGLLQAKVLDDTWYARAARFYTRDASGNTLTMSQQAGIAFVSPETDYSFIDTEIPNTSQVDGPGARFADGNNSWAYSFELPSKWLTPSGKRNQYTSVKLTLKIDNQFLIEASADGANWTELARETRNIRDHSNLASRTFDLTPFLAENEVRVRIRDSQPSDGWGGRVLSGFLTVDDASTPTTKTAFEYDAAGRQTKSTVFNPGSTPAEIVSSQTWDPRGLIASTTNETGNTTTYGYDAMGNLVTTRQPAVDTWLAGQLTAGVQPESTLGHNTFGDLTDVRDPMGAIGRTEYDVMGRKTKKISPSYVRPGGQVVNARTIYRYDERGLQTEVEDPRGGKTTTGYDAYGRMTRRTQPDPDGTGPQTAPVTTFEYDRVGQVLKTTDPMGGTVSATYDALGGQITSTVSERAGGQTAYFTTTFSRNEWGELEQVRTPTGAVTVYDHNDRGQVTSITDPADVYTTIAFDHSGREVERLTNNEIGRMFRYDAAGRLVRETDHTGGWSEFSDPLRTRQHSYDAAGRETESISPEGRIARKTYDAAGRVSTVTQLANAGDPASAATVQLGYDAGGRKTRMVDGNGNATDFTYTSWGLLESVIEPSTPAHPAAADRTWTTSYDQAGQAVMDVLPGGVTVERTFDALGRVIGQTGSGGESATATKSVEFDLLGRPTKASGPNGDTTFTWNDRSLLTATAGGAGTASFEYDADSRITKRVDKAGTTTLTYNTLGQLATTTDPLTGRSTTYGYDQFGRTNSIGYGTASAARTLQYDDLGRLTLDKLSKPDGSMAASTAYEYDRDDLITRKTVAGLTGAGLNVYGYDGLGRLTGWTRPDSAQVTYGWDQASNRTSVTTQGVTRTSTYDQRNRLTALTGGGEPDVANTFSARGTLLRSQSSASTSEYRYDAYERLIRADRNGQVADYQYDAYDRLALRNNAPFAYSGTGNDPVAMPTPAGENLVTRDGAGVPIGTKTGSGAARSLLTDVAHADVLASFDPATAGIGSSTSFAPFGEPAGAQASALGFQGGYTDPVTGQVNAHSRWYDPALGTFLSRDTWTLEPNPVSQANRYTYGNGDPVGTSDPSGHIFWAVAAVVIIISVAAYIGHEVNPQPPLLPILPKPSWCSIGCGGRPPDVIDNAPVPNPTSQTGQPVPGNKGTGVPVRGTGSTGTGKTVPAPAPPPVAVINNSKPTPRPSPDQTLAGANRPSPSVTTGQGSTRVDNGSGVTQPAPQQIDNAEEEETGCGIRCQMAGALVGFGKSAFETVVGVGGVAVDAAQCSPLWMLYDTSPCEENVYTVLGVADYAIHDPLGFGKGLWEAATEDIKTAWDEGNYGGAVGMAGFEVFDALAGTHGAGKASLLRHMPSCNSFSGDTEVLMHDGSTRAISEVQPGDRVVAEDPETGEKGVREVTATIIGEGEKHLVDITVDTDGAEGDRTALVTATDGHPFWVADRGKWVDAGDLTPGDDLRTPEGDVFEIAATAARTETTTVFNLTVAGIHTYFVLAGDRALLVHNSICKFWTLTEYKGQRIYQRDDLIDPAYVSPKDKYERTNLKRMQQGLAPMGPDDKPLNLHHMLQTQDGPIAEVTHSMHFGNYRQLHWKVGTKIPSGINRETFEEWKTAYWKDRAKDFK